MNGPELRDIHLPEAVSWWPPAPGWWLLLALLALAAVSAWLAWRRRRSTRYRALVELRRLRAEWRAGLAPRDAVDRIAALLRRTLISHRGRDGYAATSGERWLAQMRDLGPLDEATIGWLGDARYRPRQDCDVARLLEASEAWLKSLPREGQN